MPQDESKYSLKRSVYKFSHPQLLSITSVLNILRTYCIKYRINALLYTILCGSALWQQQKFLKKFHKMPKKFYTTKIFNTYTTNRKYTPYNNKPKVDIYAASQQYASMPQTNLIFS